MSIDIMGLEPHKVSRDLKGYSILIYGDPKTGKTTTAARFPNSLLLAFEKGYKAIPGVLAQPLNTWPDMLRAIKQLESEEARNKYETIIIDTADLAYDAVETYICSLHGVDAVGDIGYGKGYTASAKEFDKALQKLRNLDYGIVLISHAQERTITDEQGKEFNKITSTLGNTPRKIVNRFVDIMGYARIVQVPEVGEKTYLYMRATIRFEAGSRFPYTPPYIEFSYTNLVDSIVNAIEKQAEQDPESVVDHQITSPIVEEKTWEIVLEDFNRITKLLMEKDKKNKDKIARIVERHIGKGRKVNELDADNKDIVELINEELEEIA